MWLVGARQSSARFGPRPIDRRARSRLTVFRRDQKWIRELKLSDVGFRYVGHETTKYGVVWSAHIALEPEAELELTLADENWASVRPMDPGTRRVVMDAFKILIDKDGALERLRNACS